MPVCAGVKAAVGIVRVARPVSINGYRPNLIMPLIALGSLVVFRVFVPSPEPLDRRSILGAEDGPGADKVILQHISK